MAASEGVDLEWAIVDLARIKMNKTRKLSRKYSSKIIGQAEKCVEHLFKHMGKKFDIFHSDENVPNIGKIYAKPEPKTDIVVIKGGKKYFISVKMAGQIQLASGQGKSTAELFEAAASSLKNANEKMVLSSIIRSLKTMPTRLLSESNLGRIIEEGNAKLIEEFIKNKKVIQDKSYENWLQNHKPQLLKAILDFVQKNPNFYKALVKETLSGEITLKAFAGASANSILSPSGFFMIDEAYVKKLTSKVKMDLRAKSRGGISSVAFRIETKGVV